MTIPLLYWRNGVWGTAEAPDEASFEGGGLVISLDLWKTTLNSQKIENITNQLIDGTVTLDLTRAVPMSATFNLKNPGQVIPYVEYLQPYLVLESNDGTERSRQQLGLYATQVSPATLTVEDNIGTIEGADLCSVLAADKFSSVYNIAAGVNVVTAVKAIINGSGITRIEIPSTTKTLPNKKSFKLGMDRLTACNYLLRSINYYDLCTSLDGKIHSPGITRAKRLTEPWVSITSDDVMAPIEVTPTNDRIANVVVVTNSDSADTPKKSIAVNSDAGSPTSTTALGRRITRFETLGGKVTQADLDARAARLLEEGRTYYRTATVKILPNGLGFNPHQTIDLNLDGEMESLNGRWWIKTATMGFTSGNALLVLGLNQLTTEGLAVAI